MDPGLKIAGVTNKG